MTHPASDSGPGSRDMWLRSVVLLLCALGGVGVGHAFPANINIAAHLRAGPSTQYPVVTLVPPGASLEVVGCEEGYEWCDVQFGAERGWIDAWYLQGQAPGGPVIIGGGGAALGIPVVSFVFTTYWGNYYRARPWYQHRNRYFHYWKRYPHGRPPPRPRPPPIVRPPPRPPGGMRPPVRPPGGTGPGTRPPGGGGMKPPPDGGRPPGGGRPGRPGGPDGRPTTRPAPTPSPAAPATQVMPR